MKKIKCIRYRMLSYKTDGIEYYCPRDKVNLAETIIFDGGGSS